MLNTIRRRLPVLLWPAIVCGLAISITVTLVDRRDTMSNSLAVVWGSFACAFFVGQFWFWDREPRKAVLITACLWLAFVGGYAAITGLHHLGIAG